MPPIQRGKPLSNTDGGANRLSNQAVNVKRGVPRAKEISLHRTLARLGCWLRRRHQEHARGFPVKAFLALVE
jgi:hypothetical protein